MNTLPSPSLRRLVLRPVASFAMIVGCALPCSAQALGQSFDETVAVRQFDAKKPFTAWSESVHSLRDSLVSIARAQVGTKYVRGGQSPTRGFDCSGLVRYVMAGLHLDVPRTASQQATAGVEVGREMARLRPGDLLTFGKGRRGVSHVGIYVGHGRYVHASSVAGQVIESDLSRESSPLVRAWRGVRRVVAGAEKDSTVAGDS